MKETHYPPIGDYGLISDCHAAALISRDGSVDWCCFHRFDSRPVFSRLLDWRKGGHFRVAPAVPYEATRRYLPRTNILETTFDCESGRLVVTDCLPVREDSTSDDIDPPHPFHQLIRWIRCEVGEVPVRAEFFPRFDYGLTIPRLDVREGVGLVYGGADALVFQADLFLNEIGECDCAGEAALYSGQEAFCVLTYSRPHELRPIHFERDELVQRVMTTESYWKRWSDRMRYDGPQADHVLRSALVLKALTNSPSGAIVAAPTTSLPEEIGGARNWDYRYAWLRDSALHLYALFTLGYREEAQAFMRWIERTTAGRAEDLQVLYGVRGERMLPEVELSELDGYRGSRPVRIGNAAAGQFQLDIYGELLDTCWLSHVYGEGIGEILWDFLQQVVAVVAKRWTEPDEGIWEVRGGRRHFVFSKIMAWVAVDRAIRIAGRTGYGADLRRWKRLRNEIRAAIETQGTDPESGAFVQSFGGTELDASTLLAPLVKFLPPDHPTVVATRDRIHSELTVNDLVYRYTGPDGLPGGEGTFMACSFWLVDNYALAGEIEKAQTLLGKLVGHANDLGLLAEQVDPESGELLGNFPQAFSHAGLIGAAVNISRATNRID